MAKKIELTQGKFAIVDDEDYPYLSRFHWSLGKHKKFNRYTILFYAYRQVMIERNSINIPMADFIFDREMGKIAVYKNHNGLDLRKENIIFGDKTHRSAHSRKWNKKTTSKFKGVSWNKQRGKWRSRIMFYGKEIHLGFFSDEKEAAEAYNEKALEIYGDFAYQNKI